MLLRTPATDLRILILPLVRRHAAEDASAWQNWLSQVSTQPAIIDAITVAVQLSRNLSVRSPQDTLARPHK
jgi:hypothetical protein